MTGQQLKNSILQMAVQGKLVPQDPNDEPASVLLERIRAEKERLIKEGKIKREKNPSVIFRGADNLPYEKIGEGEPVCIADEVPFEIPESWEWVRLGSISTYAQTKEKIKAQNADPDIWGLDLEDIEKGGRLLAERSVGERRAVGDKTYFEKGDILYSKLRPYLLKILIAPNDGICTPEIVPFKLYGKLYSQYIVAFLKCPYVDTAINSATYGVKMPRVGTETMVSLFVPIPPLNEQTRIVAKLDEIFTFVDSYSNAYSRSKILDEQFPEQFKKSILQWAVQGKLVPQDPNDEPASVLLERIRAEKEQLVREGKIKRDKHESVIFRRDNSYYEVSGKIETCIDDEVPFDIPESWVWCRLSSIVSILGDGIHGTPQYSLDGEVAFINGNNLSDGKIIIRASTKTVSANEAEKHKRELNDSTVLVSINGTIGNIAFYEGEHVILGKSACFFNLLPGINKEYIKIVLETYYFSKYVSQVATGTTIKNVPLAGMREFLVPIPPEMEQLRIIERSKIAIEQITNFLL